jgi:hypothetical protein
MREDKRVRTLGTMIVALMIAFGITSTAQAGPIDPDCTPGKAAKGAAQRATVGVGNRCKAGETAKDTLGIDNNKSKTTKKK